MIDFLIVLAIIWIFAASITDIKRREVANWLSFSLIAFALVYRAFYAVFNSDLMYFVYGLIGTLLFIGLGYAFYYGRVFAGGDSKLLMSLGAVLPVSSGVYSNLLIFGSFIILLMISGSLYGLLYSFGLTVRNRIKFTREFKRQLKINKKLIYLSLVFVNLSFLFVIILKI